VSISPGLVETDFIKSMDQRWRDEQLAHAAEETHLSQRGCRRCVVVAVKNLTFHHGFIIAIDGGPAAKLKLSASHSILARSR